MMFSDVTKQNGHASVGTLYRKVLGKVVFPYDSVYKFEKGEGEAYSIQCNTDKPSCVRI